MVNQNDHSGAIENIADTPDAFVDAVDGVMVMDKNKAVKENRLAILSGVSHLFAKVADFRRIVTD